MTKPPLKATLTVGGATFISRIFGYVRDAVIFILFGANAGTDAFFVAFRIPNFLRRIFAEGAFSQAFVPVMTSHLKQDKSAFRRLIDHSSGLLSLALLFITALGMLTAPWLITLFAPGFNDPTQQQLASDMLRIVFPYLFFISLTAMAASLLNVKQRFAIPALTPVLLNVALILAAIFLAPKMAQPIIALAWGVFIGGAAQLALQIPFLLKEKCLPIPRLTGAKAGVKRIAKLMLPAIFGSSIVQLNLLINTVIASFLTVGSISWLYVSDRFVELPLAIFGVAIATVLLPMLSRQFVAANSDDFNHSLHWALRLTCLFAIPATAGLILLAEPIIISLMQYRAFTALDTQMSALSLSCLWLRPARLYCRKDTGPRIFRTREHTHAYADWRQCHRCQYCTQPVFALALASTRMDRRSCRTGLGDQPSGLLKCISTVSLPTPRTGVETRHPLLGTTF